MPLELSLERCSNACHYCFSNLNGYRFKGNYKSILNHIANFPNRKDQASLLLRHGYPICFSNRSDPFCHANYKNSVKLCELFTQMDIDVAFQTKGGPGIDDVLSFMRSSIWYITLCQDDDDLRRKIEPGTISIKDRLNLIYKLVDNGHKVNVGINPFVPEWIKNKKQFVEDIKKAGAYGVFIEGLHFSHEQKKRLKPGAIDPAIIEKSLKKYPTDEDMAEYEKLCDIAIESGMEVFSFWNLRPTDFWEPYKKLYHCFPIMTDFLNYCYRYKNDYDILDFNDFLKAVGPLPNIPFKLDSYALSVNRSMKDVKMPVFSSGIDLLKLFWSTPKFNICPVNHPALAIVAEWNENDKVFEIEDDLPVYMFNRQGWHTHFVNIQGKEL